VTTNSNSDWDFPISLVLLGQQSKEPFDARLLRP
jgi:hypothetical protein